MDNNSVLDEKRIKSESSILVEAERHPANVGG